MKKSLIFLFIIPFFLCCTSTPEFVINTASYWNELEKNPTDLTANDASGYFDIDATFGTYQREVYDDKLVFIASKRDTSQYYEFVDQFVKSFDQKFQEIGITPIYKKYVHSWAVINKTAEMPDATNRTRREPTTFYYLDFNGSYLKVKYDENKFVTVRMDFYFTDENVSPIENLKALNSLDNFDELCNQYAQEIIEPSFVQNSQDVAMIQRKSLEQSKAQDQARKEANRIDWGAVTAAAIATVNNYDTNNSKIVNDYYHSGSSTDDNSGVSLNSTSSTSDYSNQELESKSVTTIVKSIEGYPEFVSINKAKRAAIDNLRELAGNNFYIASEDIEYSNIYTHSEEIWKGGIGTEDRKLVTIWYCDLSATGLAKQKVLP